MNSSRNPFAGTWKLISWEHTKPDGTKSFPYGISPKGLLIYTENGYMSVQIMDPGRCPDDSGQEPGKLYQQSLSDTERVQAFNSYQAYCGTYDFLPEKKTMLHHVTISLIPSWAGKDQVRNFEFRDNQLILSTKNSVLTWEKL